MPAIHPDQMGRFSLRTPSTLVEFVNVRRTPVMGMGKGDFKTPRRRGRVDSSHKPLYALKLIQLTFSFFCTSFASVCKKIFRSFGRKLPEIEPTDAANVFLLFSGFTMKEDFTTETERGRAARKTQNISRKGAKAAKFGKVRNSFLCVLGVLARSIFQLCALRASAVRFPNLSLPQSDRELSYNPVERRLDV
jgi:hypothetical protein